MAQTAIVTGATSGIGWAIARKLAADGATVALVGRNNERAEALAEEIAKDGKGKGIPIIADVSEPRQIEAMIADFASRVGQIDLAVANAGVAFSATLADTSEEEWSRLMRINLDGTFYLAKHVMPHLEKSRGSFIAISSDAGTQGGQNYSAYCASKHGMVGFVRALALEMGPAGVRCNVVCPGFVETPMAEALLTDVSQAEREFYEKGVPLGRFARAYEVADAVAHLASPQASYVTGMVYAIDGGSTTGYFSAA